MPRTAPGGRQISSGGGVEMFLSSRSVWCDALTELVLSRNQHTQASSLGFHIAALQPEDQAADGRLGSMIMTGHDGGRRKPATSRRSGGRGGRMGTRLMRRTPVRRYDFQISLKLINFRGRQAGTNCPRPRRRSGIAGAFPAATPQQPKRGNSGNEEQRGGRFRGGHHGKG